jgi:hypothetical protein
MREEDSTRTGNQLPDPDQRLEAAIAEIRRAIKNVRFGSVEITIHDSRVVQIERKEKVRLEPPARLRTQ